MTKRGKTVKRTVTITETSTKKAKKIPESENSEDKTKKLLLENFISLQEALTNLGYELKDLNKKISSMLEIFETAAKNFKEHPESRNLSSKLSEIIEQNKIIAKSLLLIHQTKTTGKKSKENSDFKPSISDSEEDSEESGKDSEDNSEESDEKIKVEKDSEESDNSSEEFKPEPLPEFNF